VRGACFSVRGACAWAGATTSIDDEASKTKLKRRMFWTPLDFILLRLVEPFAVQLNPGRPQ
jgi:hypothetical protein